MNFLAHAHLSFSIPDILVGNMISDHVKGKRQYSYSPGVQAGIRLHRMIDQFTDEHPFVREIRKLFRDVYGLYSAVFTDIVLDYFVANDRLNFAGHEDLEKFTVNCYLVLEERRSIFPDTFMYLFPYMREQNWLYGYRHTDGIRRSMNGIVRRAKFMDDHMPAFLIFETNLLEIGKLYDEFYPMLKTFALHTLQDMVKSEGLSLEKKL